MNKTRLHIAKDEILNYFLSSDKKIFKQKELSHILEEKRIAWNLAQSTTIKSFINFLIEEINFKRVDLNFPFRKEVRYILGDVSIYRMLLELKPTAYFSHYSAMFFNELTEQLPKTIYFNAEQVKKINNSGNLEQASINLAFSRPARTTSNFTDYNGTKIYLLNGKNTDNLGVFDLPLDNETVRVTNLERTLIDITVRPSYSGGVFEVLNAYKKAAGKVSINKLISYLKKIDYTYPYHQAIGFYLEKTQLYPQTSLDLLKKLDIKYDFYLAHDMKEKEYSETWKLYFPKGF